MSEYPKMVYAEGATVDNSAAGSGVVVQNEDQEAWVKSGKKLADFGKEDKVEGWDKKSA